MRKTWTHSHVAREALKDLSDDSKGTDTKLTRYNSIVSYRIQNSNCTNYGIINDCAIEWSNATC